MSWRRILLLTACLLAVLLGGTWYVLQQTGAATGLVRAFLQRLLATNFHLENAQVDLLRGLRLEDITVADPSRPGHDLLAADTIDLGVELDPLGNILAIHELVIDGLRVDIDLTRDHAPNIASLLRETGEAEGVGIRDVTPARIQRGRARVRVDAELPTLDFSAVELTLQRLRNDDGDADRRRGVLRGSAHCDNLGVGVDLLGDIDLVAQKCRLQARIRDLVVDAPFLQRLLPLLRTELEDDIASGHLDELLLQLDLPLAGDDDAFATGSFAFHDVHCDLPDLPIPLDGAAVRGTVSTRDGGSARFTGERLLPNGQTEVVAKIAGFLTDPRIEVRGTGRGVVIDDTVRTALSTFPAGRAVVEGLRPTTGTADFDLYLRAHGKSEEVVDLDLQLHGVALAYHGFGSDPDKVAFPLPIVDAQGRVHLRDDVVSIEDVTARLAPEAGGGEVHMSGRVDPGQQGPERVSLDLHAPELKFTPALRAAFAELVDDDGALYDQFQPRGAAAVQLRVRPTETAASTWQVTVEPLGASGRWEGFPLPLEDVRGTILARAEGLQIDLSAAYGGGTATTRGRLMAPLDQPGALALGSVDLRIQATGVPLDQELRKATVHLTPQIESVWQQLAPSGRTDAVLHVRRDHPEQPLMYDVALELQDARALPRSFPMPITSAHGQVFVHGRGEEVEVQVDAIRGRLQERDGAGAELAVVGTIHTGSQGYRDAITAVVRGLDLDPELGATLEQTGAVGLGTWDVLRPSGKVDLITRQETADAEEQRTYTVLLRGVRSDAEMLPLPATEVSGELMVEEGALEFRDLRANMGPALVTCSKGYVGPGALPGRTEVAFRVSAERFPLDDTFARLFVGPMRQAVLDRQLRGAMNVNGLSLRFLIPADGDDTPIETVLQGEIEALDVEMLLGTRLQEINGVVTLHESHVTQGGGLLTGHLTKGSLRLFGHPCIDADAEFAIDPDKFVLRNLTLGLHGGRITNHDPLADSLTYDLSTPDGTLSASLEMTGVSLREFLQHCGLTGTPFHGTTRGWIELERLDGYDFVDMQGRGELRVVDGNLGTVPMFTAIYALMTESNRPRFESLAVGFDVRDRRVELRDLALRSPLIAVHGGGSMSMDGYLDVVVTTDSFLGGGADMLLLPPVIQMITSNLVRFHLFGFVRDVHAEQRWFAQRDPRRRPLQPVAPRLERARRPDF
ncbi:MAG: hypothetical protein AB7O97_23940 [Planctomycetota bacterium]